MLNIAVAKGRLLDEFIDLLKKLGYSCEALQSETRKLILKVAEMNMQFILAKPADVPTYVEYGCADLGIAGKDTLAEADKAIAELIDLQLGKCRLIVAVPKVSGITDIHGLDFNSRVASKYPNIATQFFNSHGIQVEVIPLHGSIELGPIIGLSEAIVDITETGRTLEENGLIIIDKIMDSSARVVANYISLKTKQMEITKLVRAIEVVV